MTEHNDWKWGPDIYWHEKVYPEMLAVGDLLRFTPPFGSEIKSPSWYLILGFPEVPEDNNIIFYVEVWDLRINTKLTIYAVRQKHMWHYCLAKPKLDKKCP